MGMILLLLSVSVPPITGNFIIPCVVDETAFIFRNPGLPMIPLYGDVDLTTIKSIHVDVESVQLVTSKLYFYYSGPSLLHRPPETGMIFRGRVRNFELSSALLPFATAESLRLPEASARLLAMSSICFLRCLHHPVLCPTSPRSKRHTPSLLPSHLKDATTDHACVL
ncbi:hypothetical protein Tco_1029668 [Tanacetum coccineum]|uniref:Uncharacterized protein n=1 Tax=Tanacetum coccineum TaxID=301880 RepID=A0ABQ5G423_9ASTR